MTDLIHQQLVLFCMAVYTGAIMAVVYDIVRIYRIIRKSRTIYVWIQDLSYWIVFGYVAYDMFLKYNYGGIRAYGFLGIGIGMVVYFGTLSGFFVKYMSLVLIKITNTLLKALKILCKPIKLGCRYIKNTMSKVITWFKKIQLTKRREIQQQDVLVSEADREERMTIEE